MLGWAGESWAGVMLKLMLMQAEWSGMSDGIRKRERGGDRASKHESGLPAPTDD